MKRGGGKNQLETMKIADFAADCRYLAAFAFNYFDGAPIGITPPPGVAFQCLKIDKMLGGKILKTPETPFRGVGMPIKLFCRSHPQKKYSRGTPSGVGKPHHKEYIVSPPPHFNGGGPLIF